MKETQEKESRRAKVIILCNDVEGCYCFRKELVEALINNSLDVYISSPKGNYWSDFENMGVKMCENSHLDRRGTNPIKDLDLLKYYKCLLRKLDPAVVLTYTIKPNVYGGMACSALKIPYIANVTGLGTSIQDGGIIRTISLRLYRRGLRRARKVFFQNSTNRSFMISHKVVVEKITDLLPGSGVNTDHHCYEAYPKDDSNVILTTIGRIMKDKGIDEILGAAVEIKKKHPEVRFRLIGDFDEDYQGIIEDYCAKGIVEYLGVQKDIHPYISESHAILHASYHEGMSNVLLEAASTGRPVIATDVPGCKETYEPNVTGIPFSARDTRGLIDAVKCFISLPHEKKEEMGRLGRKKVEQEFSRSIVVEKYMDEIKKICEWPSMKRQY